MTLQQLLLILRARAKVILTTLFATVVITLIVSLIMPKQYTADSAVVIDVKSPDPVGGLLLPGLITPGYMATQVDIITSDRVAQRVVKLLRLDESAESKEKWQDATDGKGNMAAWLASSLQKNLDVKPSRESNVINISYSAKEPALASAIANAFAQAYIDVNLEIKVEPARQNAAWFEAQTRLVRDKLETAQRAYTDQQQQTGIVDSEKSLDFETAKLNELSTQLTVVQGETSDSHSKTKPVGGSETLTEVIQSPLITTLKTDVAHLESKLQESNINLGKNHPQTQRTESELASLKSRLASETQKIASSINTSYEVGKQKEKDLLDAIATQKTRVLALNKQGDEVSVLKRDVESAKTAFENVSLRAAQTRLESLSVQTNAVILNPAFEPTEHSRPKIKLNLLIAIFLGTLLGAGLALLLELANRRVRSAEDLAEVAGLPVLASITSRTAFHSPRKTLSSIFSGGKTSAAAS